MKGMVLSHVFFIVNLAYLNENRLPLNLIKHESLDIMLSGRDEEAKMNIKEIKKDIFMLSMDIDDMLFESMWELPKGVSLNSFIIKGKKTAIVDGLIGWEGTPETLYQELSKLDINPEDIDVVVINHMEPDHSGWLEDFKKINDHFTIYTSQKSVDLLDAFYDHQLNIEVVKEGDTLDLGQGKSLSFYPIPNVHWPETMMTLEHSSKVLMTCDMFGAFGQLKDQCFYEDMSKEDQEDFKLEITRYFSNVLATFSTMVDRANQKAKQLDVDIIAPGHGPLYKNPSNIIDIFDHHCQFAKGYGKNKITILWGSMYGMTEMAVKHLQAFLSKQDIEVKSIHLPYDSESDALTNVFDSAGVILAAPTYEYKLFPPMVHALDELGRKRVTNKEVFRFGSFGWSGGAEKELNHLMEHHKMKWNFLENVEFKGKPGENDFKQIEERAMQLIKNMQGKIIQ